MRHHGYAQGVILTAATPKYQKPPCITTEHQNSENQSQPLIHRYAHQSHDPGILLQSHSSSTHLPIAALVYALDCCNATASAKRSKTDPSRARTGEDDELDGRLASRPATLGHGASRRSGRVERRSRLSNPTIVPRSLARRRAGAPQANPTIIDLLPHAFMFGKCFAGACRRNGLPRIMCSAHANVGPSQVFWGNSVGTAASFIISSTTYRTLLHIS
ncbi:hypothetical protein IWX90DRAFT_221081 [Phyllosticta citrichinensis]|uniref:Uncharacterized protein n=1 Tax=Phyllosticta citrichinensis TaxID=1130410 RepID=A0ABR1XUF6_9PEZI